MFETLDYTICIGSTQTFLYFDLYVYSPTQHTTRLYSLPAVHYLVEEHQFQPQVLLPQYG